MERAREREREILNVPEAVRGPRPRDPPAPWLQGYIYIERERYRYRSNDRCMHIYIYIYIHMGTTQTHPTPGSHILINILKLHCSE